MGCPRQHSPWGLPSHAGGRDPEEVGDNRVDVDISVATLIGWGQHGSGGTIGCVLRGMGLRRTRASIELPCNRVIKRGVDLGEISMRRSMGRPGRGVGGIRWSDRFYGGNGVCGVVRYISRGPGKTWNGWGIRIERTRGLPTGVGPGLARSLLARTPVHLGRRGCWPTLVRI